MKSLKLRDDFYWTGIIDDQLRVFDIIMYTEFGTTYNSYVMKAGDKTVLFETAKAKFFDEYLEHLQEVIDIRKIDYLVVSHTEPDHAGSVERLLDYSPQMKVIATGCALGFLKEIVNRDFVGIPARDKEKMTIGNRRLSFCLFRIFIGRIRCTLLLRKNRFWLPVILLGLIMDLKMYCQVR